MNNKILINAVDPEECRIAIVKDGKLDEFRIESASREITQGNIYKGRITSIEPSLQAVFVDYGAERHGFLQQHEIHHDYFLDAPNRSRSLHHMVKKGQELLVQVTKDPMMKKGAMLTTFISLPGRFIVLMPGSENQGISRKIADEEERERLKSIVITLSVPEGFGIIVRTAGADCTKALLMKDLKYLLRLWKNIKGRVMKEPTPSLLYKERNLVVRSIRDYFTPDIDEILIDDVAVHREAKDFVKIVSPKHIRNVKLHKADEPIFTKYELESQIASIFESRVGLKSGGSIVIESTEALVAIDVNSGKATQKKTIEQTALQTNLEAAEEIARQLRLRDLGGLIILDFIDMKEAKHKAEVEKTLRNHIKADKARTRIGRISQFGLVEMSRQRIRPSIEFGSYEPCKFCKGKGLTPSSETLGIAFLRKLSFETLKEDISSVKGIVPAEVADYVLNKKRKELLALEERRHLSIQIEGDMTMFPGDSQIICG
jgi:ribonuclease E